jgi:4-hydroxy-tetrahydrodipicolinate synthase
VLPLISALRTQDVVEYAKHAEGIGADAMLMLPPYFEGPDSRGVYLHYEQVSRSVKTPIMVYNIPIHSGIDITPDLYKKLSSEIPTVQYIKDSTGDMIRIEHLKALDANVFCGCDYLTPYALMAGAAGCFWGGSNVTPREAVDLYDLSASGKFNEALALWKKLRASNVFYWSHPYNPSIKAALEILGKGIGECRRPVLPLLPEEQAELKDALKPLL